MEKEVHKVHLIYSGHFYSASSSPLLLRGAPDTARILRRSFTPKRHKRQSYVFLAEAGSFRILIFWSAIHLSPLHGQNEGLLILSLYIGPIAFYYNITDDKPLLKICYRPILRYWNQLYLVYAICERAKDDVFDYCVNTLLKSCHTRV